MLPPGGHSLPAFGGNATSPEGYLLGLWAHECERVFADKLISKEDKSWVKATIVELCKQVGGWFQFGAHQHSARWHSFYCACASC